MNKRLFILIALVIVALALAGCQTKVVTTDGASPLYTVTAGGTGETLAAPDMAEMYFGSTITANEASDALGQANVLAEQITDAVKKAGVDSKDIQTANVSVYPVQDYQGDRAVITGYQATVQVRVKIRDIDAVGDVIGAASEAGANEISGPTFMLDDDTDAQNEAIKLAIEDARARAEVMAKAAGKDLGEIISVSEAGMSTPIYYGRTEAAVADAGSIGVEPGQLNITTSVTVVFELK